MLPRAPAAAVTAALRQAAQLNAYFALETTHDHDPAWRPVVELLHTGLAELLPVVADRLRYHDRRVVASIAFQGYAARLWSPALHCVAHDGILPALQPAAMAWRYRPGDLLELRLHPVSGWQTGQDPAPLYQMVVAGHLAPLVTALQAHVGVSARLLWGNAASALAGAARAIGPAAAELGKRLLRLGVLAGSGTWSGGRFQRRSCCLFYRVPHGGLCGDCILATRSQR